ncbi:hypothetical protein JCM10213v2_004317 [Rhodosporidiobolus nylandii]
MGNSGDDSPSRPAHHVVHPLTGTLSFKNPWASASSPTANELLFGGAWLGWPKLHLHKHPKARELQVLTPDWGRKKVRELKHEAEKQGKGGKVGFARGTWLGHASVYVELPVEVPPDPFKPKGKAPAKEGEKDGQGDEEEDDDEVTLKLLFDPIFAERAGPTSYTGPGRVRPPPCKVEDLPGVDAVFVSHNHYDHLDHGTVKAIMEKWPRAKYFVPLGNKQWLFATGVPLSQIYELDWWEDISLAPSDFGLAPPPIPSPPLPSDDAGGGAGEKASGRSSRARSYSFRDDAPTRETERIRFTCVPAQHNSGRSPTDQMSTLWAGWVVERFAEADQPEPSAPPSLAALKRRPSLVASTESFASAASDAPQQVISETVHEEPEEEDIAAEVEDGDSFAVEEDEDEEEADSRDPQVSVVPPSQSTSPSLHASSSSSLSVPLDPLSPTTSPSPPSSSAHTPLNVPKQRRRRSSIREGLQRASSFSKNLSRRLSSSSSSKSTSPSRSPSFSQTTTPSPLSRSSSLRVKRENNKAALEAQEAQAAEQRDREAALADALDSVHIHEGDDGLRLPSGMTMPGGIGSVEDGQGSRSRSPGPGEQTPTPPTVAGESKEGPMRRGMESLMSGGKRVTRKGAIYFAGDTGYRRHRRAPEPVCPAFDEMGRKFGPFDLSFVPIWRGGTLGFVSAMGLRLHHENISSALHGSPTDGVDIHLDVRSRNTIGIHFGTFIGSESEALEAIIELHEACEEAGVRNLDDPQEDELGRMGVTDIGETWCVEISDVLMVS